LKDLTGAKRASDFLSHKALGEYREKYFNLFGRIPQSSLCTLLEEIKRSEFNRELLSLILKYKREMMMKKRTKGYWGRRAPFYLIKDFN
jgi:hypothetical protein